MIHEQLIDQVLEFSSAVRYVSVYRNNVLKSKQRLNLPNSSTNESDRYEELLVNPALLTLARQRGVIDCGGLRYIIIGYGHFNQVISEIAGGHVSICLEEGADLNTLPSGILEVVKRNL
jgi:hypothetical protein